jgi:hypothetical protein
LLFDILLFNILSFAILSFNIFLFNILSFHILSFDSLDVVPFFEQNRYVEVEHKKQVHYDNNCGNT